MGAFGGVCEWSLVLLFCGLVGEGLAVGVLAVPEGFGGSVFESDHVVLPVGMITCVSKLDLGGR